MQSLSVFVFFCLAEREEMQSAQAAALKFYCSPCVLEIHLYPTFRAAAIGNGTSIQRPILVQDIHVSSIPVMVALVMFLHPRSGTWSWVIIQDSHLLLCSLRTRIPKTATSLRTGWN